MRNNARWKSRFNNALGRNSFTSKTSASLWILWRRKKRCSLYQTLIACFPFDKKARKARETRSSCSDLSVPDVLNVASLKFAMRRAQNYTAESFSNGRLASKKRKRQQDHPSCRVCRDRKVACDRRHPCENCITLRCPENCIYDQPMNDRRNTSEAIEPSQDELVAALSKVSSVDSRIARLEDAVERIAARVDSSNTISNSIVTRNHATPYGDRECFHDDSSANPHASFVIDRRKNQDGWFYIGKHNWNKPFSSNVRVSCISNKYVSKADC